MSKAVIVTLSMHTYHHVTPMTYVFKCKIIASKTKNVLDSNANLQDNTADNAPDSTLLEDQLIKLADHVKMACAQ